MPKQLFLPKGVNFLQNFLGAQILSWNQVPRIHQYLQVCHLPPGMEVFNEGSKIESNYQILLGERKLPQKSDKSEMKVLESVWQSQPWSSDQVVIHIQICGCTNQCSVIYHSNCVCHQVSILCTTGTSSELEQVTTWAKVEHKTWIILKIMK